MNLLQKTIQINNLRLAWNNVADNNGMPGVDNISIATWRRSWEERLYQLARAVRSNQYRPNRLRQRRIPKKMPGQWRTLRIPTITDRVLQRAALQQLQPIFERHFLDCSCGYRPGRGVKNAVRQINKLRRAGFEHVLDADIDDFFNQLDHTLLLEQLQQKLLDHSLLPLMKKWLIQGQSIPDKAKDIGIAKGNIKGIGIAMGSPISPLFANIYLHRLDQKIINHGYPVVRYADDFIVLSPTQVDAKKSYRQVERALAQLKLRYEPTKTSLATFQEGFEFLGVHFEEGYYWYVLDDKKIIAHDGQEDTFLTFYDPNY